MMICEEHRQTEGVVPRYPGQRCPWCELRETRLQNQELQKKLDLAYPVVEAARTAYEIRTRAVARAKSIGAVGAYEETREDHEASCLALDKAVGDFNVKAIEKPKDATFSVDAGGNLRMPIKKRNHEAGNYRCRTCDWVATKESRPLSRGTKVGCPKCLGDADYV